ncbi:hypothetical protein BGW38_000717 [Lunasporangiospora selenospora]|uniref:receptor protein-tyrosine kinase n=1 Tax=Lunasporangiospora selenospora TaxID=979761 RepID=A0A9P6KEM7_9FUNG|nr:hypothetical protein BGW38_000717 [Lunasporangiospora selenospora]
MASRPKADDDDQEIVTITFFPSRSPTTPVEPTSKSTTSTLPPAPSSTACSCPPPTCVPACKTGFVCRLSVIESTCQCPVASCAKIGFDPGTGDSGDRGSPTPTPASASSKSIVGPVVGGVLGLLVIIAVVVFLFLRRRRMLRRTNSERLLEDSGASAGVTVIGSPRPTNEMEVPVDTKGWREDVIQIKYIPGSAASSPAQGPVQSLHLVESPRAPFMNTNNDSYNKHDSIASTASTGFLDEATVMTVTKKATPQEKTSNAAAVTREESNPSTDVAPAAAATVAAAAATAGGNNGVPGPKEELEEDDSRIIQQKYSLKEEYIEDDETETANNGWRSDKQDYTPAVMVTAPSARSSAHSTIQRPSVPSLILEAKPLGIDTRPTRSPTSPSSSRLSPSSPRATRPSSPLVQRPTVVAAQSSSAPSVVAPLPSSSTATATTTGVAAEPAEAVNVITMSPSTLGPTQHQERASQRHDTVYSDNDNQSIFTIDNIDHLRPWVNSTGRDSTLSTLSDSRSSTRGEGEEIMIYWDGNRNSKIANG